MSDKVEIFTDGSCLGNPGPGGYGALLRYKGHEKALSEGFFLTTNSQYVRQGITQWIHNWKRRGWRKADKSPVVNVDLWQRLDTAITRHQIDWQWVKGHAGHPENERCDELARAAAESPSQDDTGYQPATE